MSLNSPSVKRLQLLSVLSMMTPADDSSAPPAPQLPGPCRSSPKKHTWKANAPPCSHEIKIIPIASAGATYLLLTSWRPCSEFWGTELEIQTRLWSQMCLFWFAGLHFLKHAPFGFFGFVSSLLLLQNGDFINIIYVLLVRPISENYLKISVIVKHRS